MLPKFTTIFKPFPSVDGTLCPRETCKLNLAHDGRMKEISYSTSDGNRPSRCVGGRREARGGRNGGGNRTALQKRRCDDVCLGNRASELSLTLPSIQAGPRARTAWLNRKSLQSENNEAYRRATIYTF